MNLFLPWEPCLITPVFLNCGKLILCFSGFGGETTLSGVCMHTHRCFKHTEPMYSEYELNSMRAGFFLNDPSIKTSIKTHSWSPSWQSMYMCSVPHLCVCVHSAAKCPAHASLQYSVVYVCVKKGVWGLTENPGRPQECLSNTCIRFPRPRLANWQCSFIDTSHIHPARGRQG